MDSYKAFFAQGRGRELVNLTFGVVTRIERRYDRILAYASDPNSAKDYRFWVSKEKQPEGARRIIYLREGDEWPTISHKKSSFLIIEGTVVLFIRPHQDQAAFPVISWDDYQKSLAKKVTSTQPPVLRPKDHRWVDPPPYKPFNTAS